jgi:hypothetical protein
MLVNDYLQAPLGGVAITGSGEWHGTLNGTTLVGQVENVAGIAHPCIFFIFCGHADYIGEGTWTGTLSGTQGSGTFTGEITFTDSSFSQIPVNKPNTVSGTWDSTFQIS